MVIIQSLWIGPELTDMEVYSIKSFLKQGFTFHLYTYDKVKRVPKGTVIKDANTIIPAKEIFEIKKTFLPFSDIWRYKLMYEKGGYWSDLDMICIKPFDFKELYVFSSERTIQKGAYKMKVKKVANINFLKSPKGSPFFKELYETCMEHHRNKTNQDKIKYMRMARDLIKKYKYEKYIKPPHYFCHLDWWYAKDAYLPVKTFKEKYGVPGKSINSMFTKTYTVHLWRDLVTKKYKLDTNGTYDPQSLRERFKVYIDS